MRLALVLSAAMLAAAPRPAAAALDCAQKPDNPVGYQVTAVHADQVQPPVTTPPIAVLDSGVAQVPELSGRIRTGADVTTGGQNTDDSDGHGTAVASVAAAQAGGVRGISPSSPIIPIKIFDAAGNSRADWLIEGIEKALDLGAGVINISAAGDTSELDPLATRAVQAAIDEAVTDGVPVIASSGNEGAPKLDVPASYPHVIAVGATDQQNQVASFSNRGLGLDLTAPGDGITTAAPPALCASGYAVASGTSFSAPAVAGAAALLLQAHPGLDANQISDILRLHGVRSPAPAWNADLGFGLLDVPAVLAAPVPPADAPEVDDNITFAKLHRPVLTPAKRATMVQARVATHTDPADTFRARLKKGDVFRATLRPAAGKLSLRLTNGTSTLIRANAFSVRIPKTGIYYLTVAVKSTPPAGADYSLRLRR